MEFIKSCLPIVMGLIIGGGAAMIVVMAALSFMLAGEIQ